jgi:hypothetical protein
LSWAKFYLPGFLTERNNRKEREVVIMPVLSVGGVLFEPNKTAQLKKVVI